ASIAASGSGAGALARAAWTELGPLGRVRALAAAAAEQPGLLAGHTTGLEAALADVPLAAGADLPLVLATARLLAASGAGDPAQRRLAAELGRLRDGAPEPLAPAEQEILDLEIADSVTALVGLELAARGTAAAARVAASLASLVSATVIVDTLARAADSG